MEFILSEFVGKRTSKAKLESRLLYERKYGCEGLPLRYSSFWSHMDDILPKVPLYRHMVRVRNYCFFFLFFRSRISQRYLPISLLIVPIVVDIFFTIISQNILIQARSIYCIFGYRFKRRKK